MRFIDGASYWIGAGRIEKRNLCDCLIHQEIDGRFKVFTGMASLEAAMASFAGRFAKSSMTCMDDEACDSLKEFMNVQNGLLFYQSFRTIGLS